MGEAEEEVGKAMKVLMFSRLYKPHVGGVERHVENLCRVLTGKGYEISIITEAHDDYLEKEETIDNVKVTRIKYPKIKYLSPIFIWIELLKNIKIIRQADIVHIHDIFIWYLPFRLLFPFKKVYITFHGYRSYPIKETAIILQKIAEHMTRANICIGDFIPKWYGTNADLVSYGAVDLKKFRQKGEKITYDAVFSGRLADLTGIMTYLKAVEILRKEGYKFRLVVLGDGKYKNQAERLADAKGFVEDPSSFFNKSRYAFVTGYLAILEAFASNKLVFAVYDNPLISDYLGLTPFSKWIEISDNPRGLAKKIKTYIENPGKEEKKIKKAHSWVRKQTWEKMAKNYIKLWKQ
ncbi:MAG: glycosyltransferase family 4 protein [Candidatus Woesebacteria bacterium]